MWLALRPCSARFLGGSAAIFLGGVHRLRPRLRASLKAEASAAANHIRGDVAADE